MQIEVTVKESILEIGVAHFEIERCPKGSRSRKAYDLGYPLYGLRDRTWAWNRRRSTGPSGKKLTS